MQTYNTDPNVRPNYSKWTVLDYIFAFSYILGIKGALSYGIWGITNINVSQIFIDEKINRILDLLCGIGGFFALLRWFKLDLAYYIPSLNNIVNIGNIIVDSHVLFG
jgi:uncharacterized membrane protein YuzA (DUF378 family)